MTVRAAQSRVGHAQMVQRAATVAGMVFGLAEPWRSRFLELIAQYACEESTPATPSEEEVLAWLCDEELNERVRLMLRSWTHAE